MVETERLFVLLWLSLILYSDRLSLEHNQNVLNSSTFTVEKEFESKKIPIKEPLKGKSDLNDVSLKESEEEELPFLVNNFEDHPEGIFMVIFSSFMWSFNVTDSSCRCVCGSQRDPTIDNNSPAILWGSQPNYRPPIRPLVRPSNGHKTSNPYLPKKEIDAYRPRRRRTRKSLIQYSLALQSLGIPRQVLV